MIRKAAFSFSESLWPLGDLPDVRGPSFVQTIQLGLPALLASLDGANCGGRSNGLVTEREILLPVNAKRWIISFIIILG